MALFNVTSEDLHRQFEGARDGGLLSICLEAEKGNGLPSALLLAIASRETNCVDKIGDGGHGRGVFQIDDRWHKDWIAVHAPAGVPPMRDAATLAAGMLASAIKAGRRLGLTGDALVRFGAAAYNAGEAGATKAFQLHGDADQATTHSNYGDDVATRWRLFQSLLGGGAVPAAPAAELPLLAPGARGPAVVELKTRLHAWFAAHPPAVGFADGPVYGRFAVEAVREFQRRNGLDPDGKVGTKTWGTLPPAPGS